MKGMTNSLFLIFGAGAIAIVLPLSRNTRMVPLNSNQPGIALQASPSPTPTPGSDSVKNTEPGRHEAARLLRYYFGLRQPVAQTYATGKYPAPEFLIATVPDPQETRLDDIFDHYVDAIQRACEEADWEFDRYSLPWRTSKNDSSSAQKTGRAWNTPGVLLFRHSRSDRLLVVYLIGETPTAGVHKVALRNALDEVTELSAVNSWPYQPVARNVRIMGPAFSGSAVSLAFALKSWLDQPEATLSKVEVVSGSATAIEPAEFRERTGHAEQVHFKSTLVTDKRAFAAFIKYLTDMKAISANPPRPEIALLTEANTSYGKAAARFARLTKKEHVEETVVENTEVPVLNLFFPLHISQLRAVATKERLSQAQKGEQINLRKDLPYETDENGQGESDVIPPFAQQEPAYAELVLSKTLETINREPIRYVGLVSSDALDRIFLAGEIRRHCPNVVLFTFDSDLLYLHSDSNLDFLGSLAISPYPLYGQNQVWDSFTNDLRRRQFQTAQSEGCYNATLILLDSGRLREFGFPFKENGTDSDHPPIWISIVGRSEFWPVSVLRVPTNTPDAQWLGYRTSSEGAPLRLFSGSHVGVILTFLLVFAFGCTVFAMLLVGSADLSRHRVFERMRWMWLGQLFRGHGHSICVGGRRVYVYAGAIILLSLAGVATGLAMIPSRTILRSEPQIVWTASAVGAQAVKWIPLVVIGLAGLVLIWLIAGIVRRARRGLSLSATVWAAAVLATTTSLGGLACFGVARIAWRARSDPASAVFFFERASSLLSGVSPLLPLALLVAGALLAILCVVRRLRLAEQMHAAIPIAKHTFRSFLNLDANDSAQSFGLATLEDRVKQLLVYPIYRIRWWWLPLLAIGAPYAVLFYRRYVPTVDGRYFDLFFRGMFFVVPLLLSWALLRFLWLWHAMHRLLRGLGWHPLFTHRIDSNELKQFYETLPRINFATRTPGYSTLALATAQALRLESEPAIEIANSVRSYEAAQAGVSKSLLVTATILDLPGNGSSNGVSRSAVPEPEPDFAACARLADTSLRLALCKEAAGSAQSALIARHETQDRLAALANQVVGRLEPVWHGGDSRNDKGWVEQASFFLVSHVAILLQHLVAHLQNLAGFVTSGLVLVLLAANSYPFQPRSPLLLLSWVLVLTAVSATLYVYVQMGRDRILSLLSHTTPGEVTWNSEFVSKILIHGAIPIIALLGVQFPDIVRELLTWLGQLQGGH
jgi:hypothetical protein